MGAINVVDISARPVGNSSEFQDLTRVLTIVNWSIQVKTIVDTLGLPLSDVLEKPETEIPQNTKAASFGHKTISSFITGPKEKQGLGKDWTEWAMQVKALRLKTSYEIHSDNYKEIINQFDDITKSLGRIPASASEYHFAKDSILTKQRADSELRHKMQASEMNERLTDLMKSLEREQRNAANQAIKTAELESQLESTMREMNQRLTEAQRNHDTDLERKLLSQRNDLQASMQQQMEDIRTNADMRVREAQERLEEMRSYYESSFVSKADFEITQQQLERERGVNFETMRQLNEVNKTLDNTISQLSSEQQLHEAEKDRVASLTRQIEQLTSRMNTIARAPYVGESSELAAELQMQIDELTLKLQDSTTANVSLKQREKSLLTKLKSFKAQLATVKQQNETLTSRLKKAKASIRLKAREVASAKSTIISLGVLLGASVLTSAVLIFVS